MSTVFTPFGDDDESYQAAQARRENPVGVEANSAIDDEKAAIIEHYRETEPYMFAGPPCPGQSDWAPKNGRVAFGPGTGFDAQGKPVSNSAAGMMPKGDPTLNLLTDEDRVVATSTRAKREFAEDIARFRKNNPHLWRHV